MADQKVPAVHVILKFKIYFIDHDNSHDGCLGKFVIRLDVFEYSEKSLSNLINSRQIFSFIQQHINLVPITQYRYNFHVIIENWILFCMKFEHIDSTKLSFIE